MREWYGGYIVLDEKRLLQETQSSYQVVENGNFHNVIEEFPINQNEYGVDTENRIEKMKGIFENILKKAML